MKVCSQCSAQNPDSAQFCRNCGAQVSAGESPVIVRSQNYSSSAAGGLPGTANIHNADTAVKAGAGNEAKDFFAWLVSALKRPSNPYATRVWWSFLVMAVTSVLPAFQLIITTNKAFDAYISSYRSSGYRVVGYSPTRPDIPPSVFFKFWLLFAVMLYTAVLLAFIGRKLFGDPITFLQMHDAMVQRYFPATIALMFAFLLSLLGAGKFSLIVLLVVLLFVIAVPSVVVSQSENKRAIDSFLLWCVFFVISLAVIAIVSVIMRSVMTGVAKEIISGFFTDFKRF